MIGYITVPGKDVFVMENPMNFGREIKISINSIEDLDALIEQCRDLKLKLLEESK